MSQFKIITIAPGNARFPRNSEAAILELRDGSLMLIWQEYVASEHGSEDNAPNRLAAMRSADGGLTWSEHRIVVEPAAGDTNVYSPNLLRLPNGEILFVYMHYNLLEGGKPPSVSAYARNSSDEGKTWSAPRALYREKPIGFASGIIKQLRSGRIILPIGVQTGAIWTASDHEVDTVAISDDQGQTWRISDARVDLPMRGAMEFHVEQLNDGKLLGVMRTQLGAVFQSISSDEGDTWSKPQTTGLRAPESCPELVRVPRYKNRGGELLIVWNNAEYDPKFGSHYGKRSPLTIALSRDEGKTWGPPRDVETDPNRAFSNPGLFFTSKGSAVLTYWALDYNTKTWHMGGYIDLKAAVFDYDWLYGV